MKHIVLVNSGSSANLLAISALTSYLLPDEKRLKNGDEVICVAAGFPTTINPIVQNGAIPVFIDVELETYNINSELIERAISNKTKAIFIAHTLGNPFNIEKILKIVEKYDLWLIEDNCDSLGSEYSKKKTGSFGHIATHSFYPAHHITTGEGGALATNNSLLYRIILSMRDWGRDCWCKTGHDNTCGQRFNQKFGDLPFGYDHKYVYSHLGYNLKLTDMQAALGVAQIQKLEHFIKQRRNNFNYLYKRLEEESLDDYLFLPKSTPNSKPAWFGFPITIRDNKIKREQLISFLNDKNIATRLLFGGNITKQPYFKNSNIKFRISESLKNTNIIMSNTFWVGVYPGLSEAHFDYMVSCMKNFFIN